MVKTLFSTFSLFLCFITLPAQHTDSLEKTIDKIASQFNPSTPGCMISILKKGDVIFEKAYGNANLEFSVPINRETVFNLGSISKQFTAFIILQLEHEGKLKTTDRVNLYLPEYEIFNVYPITINHLLFHTSGIRETLEMFELSGITRADVVMQADVKRFLKRQRTLNFAPGTQHSYSNGGYNALAILAEQLTGQSFPELCRKRIFEPLGMNNTFVMDEYRKIVKNKATGYDEEEGNLFTFEPSDSDYGSGNIHTTMGDFMKWAANYSSGKVGKEIMGKFFSPGMLDNGQKQVYGHGLYIDQYKELRTIEMAGARMGHRAELLYFPEQDVSIAILANTRNFRIFNVALEIADFVLADEFKKVKITDDEPKEIKEIQPITLSTTVIKKYEGLYWDRKGDLVRRLYAKEGKLFYERTPGNESELVPVASQEFVMIANGKLSANKIVFDKNQFNAFSLTLANGNVSSFERVIPVNLKQSLNDFAGTYYNDEAETRFQILSTPDSTLLLDIKRWPEMRMKQIFKDYFVNEMFGSIRFIRNSKDKITGLQIVSSGKVKNLNFEKLK